jgi:hypothetical protein
MAAKKDWAMPLVDNLDQLVKAPTCTGDDLVKIVLLPSWPTLFIPHDHSVPSVFVTTENARPDPAFDQSVESPI